MIKLYHVPLSFNSRRVWITLLEKGLDFELIEMQLSGDQMTPEFIKLNPFHHIPVLVDGDFRVIESFAILDYLEAKYPNPSLLPKDPQSLAIVKMVQMVIVNEFVGLGMQPLMRKSMQLGELTDEQLTKATNQTATVLTFLEELLGENSFFGGENLTLGDIVAGTTIPWLNMLGFNLEPYTKINQWIARLTQRESWQKTQPTKTQIDDFVGRMKARMGK
jgi:glutathione S-transferase